ncbi:MAG: glycerophosphoryl diester phosphodiesterase [Verrucomicrobiales bacterium]|jgi:glycerophosphoryl diester phosphodiesterase
MTRHPYLQNDGPIGIAHRGGAREAPENTMESFLAASELGFRYLETDAQLTADGTVVAFHDETIDRVSDQTGAISSWAWDALAEVPIYESGHLSTMSDLLTAFPGHRFNLDAKSDAVVEPLLRTVGEVEAFDRVCFGSFSHRRLAKLRSLGPANICTSFAPIAIARQVLRGYGRFFPRPAGNAAQVPPSCKGIRLVTERFIEQAHADDLAVHVWTVDEPNEMHRLLDLGVDGIMTDRPSVLKAVFEERGLNL